MFKSWLRPCKYVVIVRSEIYPTEGLKPKALVASCVVIDIVRCLKTIIDAEKCLQCSFMNVTRNKM